MKTKAKTKAKTKTKTKAKAKSRTRSIKKKRKPTIKSYDRLIINTFLTKDVWILPPCKRNIKFFDGCGDYSRNDDDVASVAVPFPYVIFVRQGGQLFIAFANEKPTLSTKIYFPPLPNIHRNFGVCMTVFPYDTTEEAIARFWNSPFHDLTEEFDSVSEYIGQYVLDNIGGFEAWRRKRDATKINWPIYTTLGAWLRRLPGQLTLGLTKQAAKKTHSIPYLSFFGDFTAANFPARMGK